MLAAARNLLTLFQERVLPKFILYYLCHFFIFDLLADIILYVRTVTDKTVTATDNILNKVLRSNIPSMP